MKRIGHDLMLGLTAVAMLWPAVLVAAGETNGSASSRVLELQVVNRQTQMPIAGVNLEIRIGRESRKEVTDEQGRCRIDYGPQPPTYLSVRASGKGLVPVQVVWRVTGPAVQIPAEYALAMDPGTSIGGIIQDEEGRPIEGGMVYLLVPSDSAGDLVRVSIHEHPVKTDAQGRWRCDIMPARLDDIWIRLAHPDYISDEMYGATPKPPIEQLLDMTGVMVLKKGVTVAGRVVDANGVSIEGATVAQGSDRFGSHYPSVRTDGEGRFEFANAKPAQMVLTVQAGGYAPELREVFARQGLEPVEFCLQPGRTLRGRIVNKAGEPIAGAFVAADTWRGHRSLHWRVDTDDKGRFRWDEAPVDEVLIDMGKQDYMSIRHYSMTASDEEYTITMHPLLRVKGRVTDEETGEPIPEFTAYPGIDWGNGRAIYWQRQQGKPFSDGSYEITFGEPRLAHLVRVEAEGYLPGESRRFEDSEGEVTYDFALKKGVGPSATVCLPDGQPAAAAEVILCTPSQAVFIRNGRNQQRRESITVRTGPDGRFSFPPQTDPYRVVVLHDQGYADLAEEEMAASSQVKLRPWGRIEGKVLVGSRPGAGEGVRVLYDRPHEDNAPRVEYDCSAVADSNGCFVLERLRPGPARICREVRVGERMTRFTRPTSIEIKAGDSTRVTLGGTGRPVIGTVAIPDPIRDKLDWQSLDYYLQNQSSDGPYRILGVKFERDGTFRADDVPAGSYCLHFSAYRPATDPRQFRGESIGSLVHPFTIPEMPTGRSDEPLDLGVLHLVTLAGSVDSPFLVGRKLPGWEGIELGAASNEIEGKRVLVCFFDMQQRPSRNSLLQLARQIASLRDKGVVVIALQASPVERSDLDGWLKDNKVPLRVGTIQGDEEATRSAWGVKSLPWLILTDCNHTVVAEGFTVGELDEKVAEE